MVHKKLFMSKICLLRWYYPCFFDELSKISWSFKSYLQNVNEHLIENFQSFKMQLKLFYINQTSLQFYPSAQPK